MEEISLSQEIYQLNRLLKKYNINFYYSLKKDGIFIIHGWMAQKRLQLAYFLSAIGSVLFTLTMFYHDSIFRNGWLNLLFSVFSAFSLAIGIYIIYDFYSKLKNLQSTVLIKKDGISFREKDEIILWKINKIKNIEVVQMASQKQAMKAFNEELKLKRRGKIVAYLQTGETKELIELNNKNREELKNDLEKTKKTIYRFMNYQKKVNPPIVEDSLFDYVNK